VSSTPTGSGSAPANLDEARAELNRRCNAIEECYEFMLAYAAQGLASDTGSQTGGQIRVFLGRCDEAMTNLAGFLAGFVAHTNADAAAYAPFLSVIERDARDSQAALRMVIAQPSISSALIDNLNASIHLRALLTDLFLIDEVLKSHRSRTG
jgi:hypothetical protein